jgi:hypothetical protein
MIPRNRRITFTGYIFLKMTDYQRENGDLRGFKYMEVPNRNPKQVPEILWKELLLNYLKHQQEN